MKAYLSILGTWMVLVVFILFNRDKDNGSVAASLFIKLYCIDMRKFGVISNCNSPSQTRICKLNPQSHTHSSFRNVELSLLSSNFSTKLGKIPNYISLIY